MNATQESYAFGLDLGGTYIKAAVVSETGRVLTSEQVGTPISRTVEDVSVQIGSLINRLHTNWPDAVGVGLGSPGLIDRTSRSVRSSPNFPSWSNVPLRELIAKQIALPIDLENDVNCFALGEHRWGAGKGYDPMLALAVGTGIGGGIIIDEQLYRGESGAAGELGHISIDYQGPRCNCGGYGCVERYLGNYWFVEAAAKALPGHEIKSPKDVSDLASAGNVEATRFIEERGELLGVACASLMNIFDPAAIVIGGGTAQCGEPFFRGINRSIQARAYPELAQKVAILPAQLGTIAGALGAAAIGFEAGRLP